MKQRTEHTKPKFSTFDMFIETHVKSTGKKEESLPDPLNILFLPTITVKFREGTAARIDGKQGKFFSTKFTSEDLQYLERAKLTSRLAQDAMGFSNGIIEKLGARSVQRLLGRPIAALDAEWRAAQKLSREELADPTLYFIIEGKGRSFGELAKAVDELNSHPAVEIAYLEPVPYPAAVDIAPVTPPMSGQDYLDPAPDGIDARYAWSKPGGRGENLRAIDVEFSWHLDHEDLPGLFYNGSGINLAISDFAEHGTAVLGVLAAQENRYGFTGIVPRVNLGVKTWFGIPGIAHAIDDAAAQLRAGDVLIVEIHYPGPTTNLSDAVNGSQAGFLPVDYFPASFDVICRATRRGIVVIEAAGNGQVDLDSGIYQPRLDRNQYDSGAIMVGAGQPRTRTPEDFTNFGSRVDVQGWGSQVATLGYGDIRVEGAREDVRQWYTSGFGGTSSATPIVAGAAIAIQSALISAGLNPLSPIALRQLLRETGTEQPNDARQIGPLPNVRAALDRVLPPPPVRTSTWPSLGGVIFGTPVVAKNGDGRMEVFAIGGEGRLWHQWQTAPSNGWSGWSSMPSSGMRSSVRLRGQVAAANAADGRIEVFVLGDDNHLWHIYQTSGGWSGWEDMGGDFTSDPAVGTNDNGRLEVFIRGGNGSLMHTWQMSPNGGWHIFGWQTLGGNLQGAPSVASNADRRLEVFVRGTGNALQHIAQTSPGGSWTGWFHRGGVFTGDPVATQVSSSARAVIEVIAPGTDGQLYATRQSPGGWGNFEPIGGSVSEGAEVAVQRRRNGNLAVFARFADGSIRTIDQTAGSLAWATWRNLEGTARSNPAAGINADGRLEVFAIGSASDLVHLWEPVF